MTTTREGACFAFGFGAGVTLAMLFAPRTGSEARNEILATMEHGHKVLRDGKSAVTASIQKQKEGIGAAIDAGKNAYQEAAARD